MWLIGGLAAIFSPSGETCGADRPNVLLIAVDDLNDWVSCLKGHPDARTPNIDRLARRGVLFTNAHCQAPICNPSRTSFMTGLRPSTTGIYMNSPWFRNTAANKNRVTLTQHFSRQGYRTYATGKIYHGSRVDAPSFAVNGPRPGQRLGLDEQVQTELESRSRLWDFGPQTYDESKFGDFVTATWAIQELGTEQPKPFFLAVGFYRPHVPWYAPKRIFDQIDHLKLQLPPVKKNDVDDLPELARKITFNALPPSQDWWDQGDRWKRGIEAYLASTRFTDEQVGRLLDALDAGPHARNTIIIFLSDHGFFLGEKRRWAKQSLWERATRVPFIVAVPGGATGRCSRPVELLSVYPTLIELCGIEARPELEGASLVPLLKDPAAAWDRPAITTFGRDNHAVRSERWRYIRYSDGSEELYDHTRDPNEWTNLAGDPKLARIKKEHAAWSPNVNVPDARNSARKPNRKPKKKTSRQGA